MPRIDCPTGSLAVAALALWLGLAPPAAAETNFIVFHSPSGNGDALGSKPAVQPLSIPVGTGAPVRAFLENHDPLGPGSADPASVCVSATSNHVCGWRISFVASGMRIDGFAPPSAPADPIESNLLPGGGRLDVTGGSPNGQTGPVPIGTLQVTALSPGGTLVAQSSYLDAAGGPRGASKLVAVVASTCGNGELDSSAEQCDDGNLSSGDGCFASCRSEYDFTLSGTARGGSITLALAERSTPLGIPTIPGETGAALAVRVTTVMNEDPALDSAGKSAENPSAGRIVTDAVTNDVTSSDPGITVMPEPDALAGLGAGVLLLRWLARRRLGASRRRAQASAADSG